jgi:hypothetical protein
VDGYLRPPRVPAYAAHGALTSESMRQIDHLVFAAPDLEDGVYEVEARFGVRAGDGGQH